MRQSTCFRLPHLSKRTDEGKLLCVVQAVIGFPRNVRLSHLVMSFFCPETQAFYSWQFIYIIIISTLLNSFSFHSWLKTYLFTSLSHHRLLVPYPWTAFSDLDRFSDLLCLSVCFIFLSLSKHVPTCVIFGWRFRTLSTVANTVLLLLLEITYILH